MQHEHVLMEYEDYTNYTSELCHMLKRMGDINFAEQILYYVDIDELLRLNRKKHALYTVAIIDYVCHENQIPMKKSLEKYRSMKLDTLSFSSGVETYTKVVRNNSLKQKVLNSALKEFLEYNIVETSVRNVS